MDYENKYKEALGWMQSIYPTMTGAVKEDAEHYFPELKESEDERIRKALIEFVKSRLAGFPQCEKFIAWLEKQGEQKPAENKGMNLVEEEMTPFQKKVFCIIDTTIEEEQGLKQVCDELLTLASNEIKQKPTTEIKSAEESLGIDSETYNKIVDECIYGNNEQKSAETEKLVKGNEREIPFSEQEWSEEDEKMIQDIINDIAIAQEQVCCKSRCEDEINWLKLLRPQNKWKPSKEQMEALDDFIYAKYPNTEKYGVAVKSLYQDLKKLREE